MVQRFNHVQRPACAKFCLLLWCQWGAKLLTGLRPWCYCWTVTQFDKDSVATWTQYDPVIWQRSLQTTSWCMEKDDFLKLSNNTQPDQNARSSPETTPNLPLSCKGRSRAGASPKQHLRDPQFRTTSRGFVGEVLTKNTGIVQAVERITSEC